MLESYIDEAFRDFECANKLRLKTVMPDQSNEQIEVECYIKPSFHVIDDNIHVYPNSNQYLKPKGKRVVYYMKILNVRSSHKNFDEK